MRRLIENDTFTGTQTWHNYDHETRITTIQTVQDVEPYLRRAHAEKTRADGGAGRLTSHDRKQIKDGQWLAATIPAIIQHKWLIDYGLNIYNPDHHGRMHKLLDSPDWEYLKTTTGKIGRYKDGR